MPTISRTATPTYTFDPADTTAAFTYEVPSTGTDSKAPSTPQGTFIVGTAERDILNGTSRDESIHGGGGNDSINGGGGNDRLFGGEGNDSLTGGEGDDVVDGGAGDDTIMAGNGNDTFIGGAGSDTLDFRESTLSQGIFINLAANFSGTGDTISGIENVNGTIFNDMLSGDANNNRLFGSQGDDYLFGLGGNDTLLGGVGEDTLNGGDGDDFLNGGDLSDKLTGGAGADTFVLSVVEGSHGHHLPTGPDVIMDFKSGTDKIELHVSGIEPALGNDGVLAFGTFGSGETGHFSSLDGSDRLVYDYESQTLYLVDSSFEGGTITRDDVSVIAHINYDPTSGHITGADFLL